MRITSEQDIYVNSVFGLDTQEMAHIRERMLKEGKENMSISGAEARILQFFVRALGVKKIAEFGTLFGYSGLAMASVLPKDGLLVTLEKDPKHHAFAQETFRAAKCAAHIVSLCGDAVELLPEAAKHGPFDLVFIDANKSGYCDYLNWAEENVRKGGLIVGDNTFLFGAFWDRKEREHIGEAQVRIMKEFNARLSDPSKYNSMLVPTVEGLTVAQKL